MTRTSDEEPLVRARPVASMLSPHGAARSSVDRRALAPYPSPGPGAHLPRRSRAPLEIWRSLARVAEIAARAAEASTMGRVEQILSQASLAESIVAMTDAAGSLAANPEAFDLRLDLVARAEALAASIRSAARALATVRRSIGARVLESVERANTLLAIVAAGEMRDDSRAPTLSRSKAIPELAGLLGISFASRRDGVRIVHQDGTILVAGDGAARLDVAGLDGRTEVALVVHRGDEGPVEIVTSAVGGSLGALLTLYAGELPRWSSQLEGVAAAVRDGANQAHAHAGARDLDGYAAGDLFCGERAADLAVAVAGPRGIAVGRGTSDPNGSARALARLGMERFDRLDGATIREHLEASISRLSGRDRAGFRGSEADTAVFAQRPHAERRG